MHTNSQMVQHVLNDPPASSIGRTPLNTAEDEQPNLDLLRSLAVTTVLADHLVPTLKFLIGYDNPALLALTLHIGHAGVLAFFVHTSLVLMYSLDRLDRSGHGLLAVRFYIRRVFRIYPLSVFCIATALLLDIPAMTWRSTEPITWKVTLANLLLIQNLWTKQSVLGPLWSLPYEVQMYLVLPLLHRYARRSRSAIGLLALFGIFCAIGTAIAVTSGRMNMAAYVPCFVAGVLCYALRRSQREKIPAGFWPWFVCRTHRVILGCQSGVGGADLLGRLDLLPHPRPFDQFVPPVAR